MNESLAFIALAAAVVAALLAGMAFVVLLRFRAELGRQATATAAMQQDLRALCNAAVTVGERVNRLEATARDVAARQEELGVRQDRLDQSKGDERSYEQAIKLAQKGAPVEDLVELCGLARGEAELIAMMHRLDKG